MHFVILQFRLGHATLSRHYYHRHYNGHTTVWLHRLQDLI